MLLVHRIKTREGVLYSESPLRQITQVAYVIKKTLLKTVEGLYCSSAPLTIK